MSSSWMSSYKYATNSPSCSREAPMPQGEASVVMRMECPAPYIRASTDRDKSPHPIARRMIARIQRSSGKIRVT
jgi:hypothetical protein